ncbi:hypothetical protein FDP41_013497 [Naegleria fowleri]|uniref:CCHC-type domain-containing protein n=1 Tax=Naegleria fowleri TaxID=5763 RepID=A0A6A5BQG3_NAEFO|nr:uncharacterized protein FDP41_013497 [Naegleria fowleri]KAF0980283.1 hypothetical protein FDP41_013497 [Naegleria fowleri]
MPRTAQPPTDSVVEVIIVNDDSQTPTTPSNRNNFNKDNEITENIENRMDSSVIELSLEREQKVIDLEASDDPNDHQLVDKSNENVSKENHQENTSPILATRRIPTPSIIPDETIEMTNSQEPSLQSMKLQTEQPTSTTDLVNLLQMTNSAVNSKETPGELEKLKLEKGSKKKPKPSRPSIRSTNSSEENSNIKITFSNIGVHVVEKIQKLLEEEYVKNDSKKPKRKTKSLCSGTIEANPLFITEKINFDEKYLKHLNIQVEESSSEEESTLNSNSNQTNKTCYNCLGFGHILADCPYELDFEEIDKNRDTFRKKPERRIFEVFGQSSKRNEKKTPLDIKNFAVKLSEKAKKKTSPSVLESYKGDTPQNKIHEKDVGTVSEEFLYGGNPIEASNFEEKKQKLSKVFTRLKEHKEFEKKRKFDQFSKDDHDYIHIHDSQDKYPSQGKSKKSKEQYHKKRKQSYDKSDDDGENLDVRKRYDFRESSGGGGRGGNINSRNRYSGSSDRDRYYYEDNPNDYYYGDDYERRYDDQRRYYGNDNSSRNSPSKKYNDSKNQSNNQKQNSKNQSNKKNQKRK